MERTSVCWRWSMQASKPSSSVTYRHLSGPAGNADDMTARNLGELAGGRTHRTACGRNQHGLAGLRRTDLLDPIPRRYARHAQYAEIRGHRNARRVDLVEAGAARQAVLLPAKPADDGVADRELRDCSRPRRRPRCRRSSSHRSVAVAHTTSLRSCGRACTDRATGSGCAPAPRPRRASALALLQAGNCPAAPRLQDGSRGRCAGRSWAWLGALVIGREAKCIALRALRTIQSTCMRDALDR